MHRDNVRSVRLSDEELAAIERASAFAGLRPAGFMAAAALAVAQAGDGAKAQLLDRRGELEELMAASAQLARVGNNLNQVAKAANSGAAVTYLDDVLRLVARATARVEEAALDLAGRR